MQRGVFSSRLAFIFAASGSAVGLGNIWGFPTNAAENGGAAFVLMYLILAFLLAYPAMMAELIIGRHTRSNVVNALQSISSGQVAKITGTAVGFAGMVTASLILCFYAIVAGWMIAFMFEPATSLFGLTELGSWLTDFSLTRNIGFSGLFILLTGIRKKSRCQELNFVSITRDATQLTPKLIAWGPCDPWNSIQLREIDYCTWEQPRAYR